MLKLTLMCADIQILLLSLVEGYLLEIFSDFCNYFQCLMAQYEHPQVIAGEKPRH